MIRARAAQRRIFNLQRKFLPMNKEPDRSQRKALGKGLSALLPSRSSSAEAHSPAAAPPQAVAPPLPGEFEEFQNVPLEEIQPGEQQPRGAFDDEKLHELAESIRAHGMI